MSFLGNFKDTSIGRLISHDANKPRVYNNKGRIGCGIFKNELVFLKAIEFLGPNTWVGLRPRAASRAPFTNLTFNRGVQMMREYVGAIFISYIRRARSPRGFDRIIRWSRMMLDAFRHRFFTGIRASTFFFNLLTCLLTPWPRLRLNSHTYVYMCRSGVRYSRRILAAWGHH